MSRMRQASMGAALLLLGGLLVPLACLGDDVALPPVTVQAPPLDLYLPTTTNVTRDEVIESRKTDVSQVLALTPGVNVRMGGRAEPRINIRGFGQRSTLLTLDGVPVYEPWNGIVNLDLFPLEMLGGISVTRGAASAMYGPNGMAGTIKLRTALPKDSLAGAVGETWRDSKYWDTHGSAGVADDRGSVIVGGRYLTSDGYPLSGDFNERPPNQRRNEDGGTRDNSDRNLKSLFAGGTYRLDDDTNLHAMFVASDSTFGIPPSTTQFIPVVRRTDPEDLLHGHVSVDTVLSPTVRANAAVFSSLYRLHDKQYLERVVTTRADSDEVGSIGQVSVDLADTNTFSVGGLIRYSWADISDSERGHIVSPDFTTGSAVAEDTWFLLPQLVLVTGVSLDVQDGSERGTDWEFDPQGGLYYDLGQWGTARGAVSRKTRFPTLRELYDPLQGDPNLSAENAFIAEIGYQIARESAYADVSLFRNDVNNLIMGSGIGGSGGRSTNLQDALLQGVEVAVGGTPQPWLRLDLNYTYLDATAKTPRGNTAEIQHRPPHRFNGVAQFFLVERFRLRIEGIYSSSQREVLGSDLSAPQFGLLNLALSRQFGDYLDLFVGCDNVLDADYEEQLGLPQPGRWLFVGMRASFGKEA